MGWLITVTEIGSIPAIGIYKLYTAGNGLSLRQVSNVAYIVYSNYATSNILEHSAMRVSISFMKVTYYNVLFCMVSITQDIAGMTASLWPMLEEYVSEILYLTYFILVTECSLFQRFRVVTKPDPSWHHQSPDGNHGDRQVNLKLTDRENGYV